MSTLIKYPQRQDCYFKLSAGNSGETSLNLSTEIALFLNDGKILSKGDEIPVSFILYKEDFIKAICHIVEKLPLFKTSSTSSTKVEYSNSFFLDNMTSVSTFFGNSELASYNVTLSAVSAPRYYLKDLNNNGFNLRKFLTENNSILYFSKEEGTFVIRLVSDEVKPEEAAQPTNIEDSAYSSHLTALRTKPFLLLAGISGTGKSRIVKEMAFASCPNVAELRNDPVSPGNYLLVEVKPNWHDSTELLGYESAIKTGYVLTPFVKFLYKAMKHPEVPFFVCLDEMNLAPVEQYFAEFLSILESRKQQADGTILTEPLIRAEVFRKYPELCAEMNGLAVRRERAKGDYLITDPAEEYIPAEAEYKILCEEGLRIPQNVVVIGTVNMDETTHQFSRKVIDRAMTIEMNEVKFDSFFESSSELTYADDVLPKEYFLPRHTTAGKALESMPDDAEHIKEHVPALLEQLNEALADTPFKIAYRVQNELVLYFAALRQEEAHKETPTAELLATAMDQILMMKVLPRIEGDDELLEKPLERLAAYAQGYPKASAKIKEMQERLGRSHFTSFWP